MDAVSGGGVPVGSYYSGSAVQSNTIASPLQAVPATWASTTIHKMPHKGCTAITKKGDKCQMPRVEDTELCVSHWQTVGSMVSKGLVNVAQG